MSKPPQVINLYHITHVRNLQGIAETGVIYADAEARRLGLDYSNVGISDIKRRRLESQEVVCHPGSMVGEYVPFNFCFRSVMLYIIHKGNHPQLSYRDGQRPILHLVLDFAKTIRYCTANGMRWAFSDMNAANAMARFFNNPANLDSIDWKAVANRDFRQSTAKDAKQAEFLVHTTVPWELVERIGVIDETVRHQVVTILGSSPHRPPVDVVRDWYY